MNSKFLLLLTFCAILLTACSQGSSSSSSSTSNELDWPDTSNWITLEAEDIMPGLTLQLPPNMEYFAHSGGITLFINEEVIYSIDRAGGFNAFDMQETREWLENSSSRADLVWLIDEENLAYYTGQDLGAPTGHQTTHSCYGYVMVGDEQFHMEVDGITIGEETYNLSQQECLTFITILKSLQLAP